MPIASDNRTFAIAAAVALTAAAAVQAQETREELEGGLLPEEAQESDITDTDTGEAPAMDAEGDEVDTRSELEGGALPAEAQESDLTDDDG